MSNPAAIPIMGPGPEKQPDNKSPNDREEAEKQCTCSNKSFDVQLLAGLCQSCIRKTGNRANSECNILLLVLTIQRGVWLGLKRGLTGDRPGLHHEGVQLYGIDVYA